MRSHGQSAVRFSVGACSDEICFAIARSVPRTLSGGNVHMHNRAGITGGLGAFIPQESKKWLVVVDSLPAPVT